MNNRDIYCFVDELLEIMSKIISKEFKEYKSSILSFDNINKLQTTTDNLFKRIDKQTRKHFYDEVEYYISFLILMDELTDIVDNPKKPKLNKKWLDKELKKLNPVDKYIYENELERKKSRLFESVASTDDINTKSKEVDKQSGYTYRQVAQEVLNILDSVQIETFEANGITKVKWISEQDERVCSVCNDRNNIIYPIKELPPRPHRNCRCRWIPVKNID